MVAEAQNEPNRFGSIRFGSIRFDSYNSDMGLWRQRFHPLYVECTNSDAPLWKSKVGHPTSISKFAYPYVNILILASSARLCHWYLEYSQALDFRSRQDLEGYPSDPRIWIRIRNWILDPYPDPGTRIQIPDPDPDRYPNPGS